MKQLSHSLFAFTTLWLAALVFAGDETNAETTRWTYPPDWAPQEAIWIGWPESVEPPNSWVAGIWQQQVDVKLSLIKELLSSGAVTLLVASDAAEQQAKQSLSDADIDLEHIRFHHAPGEELVVRDSGPRFLTNGSALRIADIAWECYAYLAAVRRYARS